MGFLESDRILLLNLASRLVHMIHSESITLFRNGCEDSELEQDLHEILRASNIVCRLLSDCSDGISLSIEGENELQILSELHQGIIDLLAAASSLSLFLRAVAFRSLPSHLFP